MKEKEFKILRKKFEDINNLKLMLIVLKKSSHAVRRKKGLDRAYIKMYPMFTKNGVLHSGINIKHEYIDKIRIYEKTQIY